MKRLACAALALAILSPPGFAAADEVQGLKVTFKVKEINGAKKVLLRLEVPSVVRTKLKRKRTTVKINLYAGKDSDTTKRVKQYKWKLTRPMRKWSFKQKDLCKKGYRHLRLKLKAKARGEDFDEVKKTLELDC